MSDAATSIAISVLVILLAILGIGIIIGRLYHRAAKDRAYVRTGLGGQKVILDGGAVVLPIFQSIAWVNLQTLRIDVRREKDDAMITSDRIRVDASVDFYVRVKPDEKSIALAAQTLGDRANEAAKLRELVEPKFVDALRSVAAKQSLDHLQEERAQFVLAVQTAVAHDLGFNGLELESVSLTRLNQTEVKYFNAENAFDAQGMTALTKITAAKQQERNQITRAAEVAIAQQDLEARRLTLEIERAKQEATLSQQRDIANKTAATRAETAQKEAEARRAEGEAGIETDQAIALRQAQSQRARETALIEAQLEIRKRQLDADQTSKTLDAATRQAIEIADQVRTIAVAQKSREQSEAKAAAEAARAIAIAAEESVATAREVAIAERDRQIAVIAAKREAEREATKVTVAAEAQRRAAEDLAEAKRLDAHGEADATRIRAEGRRLDYAVEAEGQGLVNEARNKLDPRVIDFEVARERLKILPQAIAESVKPAERIKDIRIFDMGGFGAGGFGAAAPSGSPTETLTDALLRYRAQGPVIDTLLRAAGFEGSNPLDAMMREAGRSNDGKPEPASAPPSLPAPGGNQGPGPR